MDGRQNKSGLESRCKVVHSPKNLLHWKREGEGGRGQFVEHSVGGKVPWWQLLQHQHHTEQELVETGSITRF